MKLQCLVMRAHGKPPCRGILKKGILQTLLFSLALLFSFTSYAAETIELPDELKHIQITDEFIKSTHDRLGTITVMKGEGDLIIVRDSPNKGFIAEVNDSVYEKDILYTLADCKCRITFFDENEIVMAANTHLEMKDMHSDIFRGEKRTIFGMSKGKAVFLMKKLFQFRNAKVQLDTPTTAIGVRGTIFGVEVKKVKKGLARIDIQDRMIASTSLQHLVIASPAANAFQTSLYLLTGIVACACNIDNTQATLTAGQSVVCGPTGLGAVMTVPGVVAAFVNGVMGDMDPDASADPASASSGGDAGGCSGGSH